ncbi:hypothetical protein SUGI_0800570 [Cryptomeria japonica]|nr:hypothetical protein SUGI_0800570 [Cryptomeria japonica]
MAGVNFARAEEIHGLQITEFRGREATENYCSGCMRPIGEGFALHCRPCNFVLHLTCIPQQINHPAHPHVRHVLHPPLNFAPPPGFWEHQMLLQRPPYNTGGNIFEGPLISTLTHALLGSTLQAFMNPGGGGKGWDTGNFSDFIASLIGSGNFSDFISFLFGSGSGSGFGF